VVQLKNLTECADNFGMKTTSNFTYFHGTGRLIVLDNQRLFLIAGSSAVLTLLGGLSQPDTFVILVLLFGEASTILLLYFLFVKMKYKIWVEATLLKITSPVGNLAISISDIVDWRIESRSSKTPKKGIVEIRVHAQGIHRRLEVDDVDKFTAALSQARSLSEKSQDRKSA
jgi:hypothetical protein